MRVFSGAKLIVAAPFVPVRKTSVDWSRIPAEAGMNSVPRSIEVSPPRTCRQHWFARPRAEEPNAQPDQQGHTRGQSDGPTHQSSLRARSPAWRHPLPSPAGNYRFNLRNQICRCNWSAAPGRQIHPRFTPRPYFPAYFTQLHLQQEQLRKLVAEVGVRLKLVVELGHVLRRERAVQISKPLLVRIARPVGGRKDSCATQRVAHALQERGVDAIQSDVERADGPAEDSASSA